MSEIKSTRKRGRPAKLAPKDRNSVILQVLLTEDLKEFALSQGGSEWVRKWIQEQEIQSRIV